MPSIRFNLSALRLIRFLVAACVCVLLPVSNAFPAYSDPVNPTANKAAPEKGENIDDTKSLLLHEFGAGLDVLGGEDSDTVDRRSGEVDVVNGDFRCESVSVCRCRECRGSNRSRVW